MTSDSSSPKTPPKAIIWTGRVITILVFLMMVMGASMALTRQPKAIEGLAKYGYPENVLIPLAIVQLTCAILYLIPQTAMLGAILLTGYLGGATATHVRAGEPFFFPVLFGVIVWLGLFFRERRLWSLVPIRCLKCCKKTEQAP